MPLSLETLTQDDLIDFAKISFDHPMGEMELDRMFTHVGSSINARIVYEVVVGKETGPRSGEQRYNPDGNGPAVRGIRVTGSIFVDLTKLTKGPAMAIFRSFVNTGNHAPTINGVEFDLTPGYSVSELRASGDLEFIEKVRGAIEFYQRGEI